MARTPSRTRKAAPTRARAKAAEVNPRTLFLASLGVIVRGQREAERLAAEVVTVPVRLRAGADAAVSAARAETNAFVRKARSSVAPLRLEAERLSIQAQNLRKDAVNLAAARLNPLLGRAGLPVITPVRKAAVKKASTRRAVKRPVAKAARRKA